MAGKERAEAKADVLRRVSYFATLTPAELGRLAAACAARTIRGGATIFEEGQPCGGLLVVVDGLVEVRQVSFRGREQVFHTEGPGATLGEGPLFDGGPYIASAVAARTTRLLFIPRAAVLRLCQERPQVAVAMLRTMARRIRHFAGIVADLAFRPVIERLARFLESGVGPSPEAGRTVDLAMTQAQLAARLGTVRELVARALAELEAGGIIARRRSRVTIRDPVRLAALARGAETAARRRPRVT